MIGGLRPGWGLGRSGRTRSRGRRRCDRGGGPYGPGRRHAGHGSGPGRNGPRHCPARDPAALDEPLPRKPGEPATDRELSATPGSRVDAAGRRCRGRARAGGAGGRRAGRGCGRRGVEGRDVRRRLSEGSAAEAEAQKCQRYHSLQGQPPVLCRCPKSRPSAPMQGFDRRLTPPASVARARAAPGWPAPHPIPNGRGSTRLA